MPKRYDTVFNAFIAKEIPFNNSLTDFALYSYFKIIPYNLNIFRACCRLWNMLKNDFRTRKIEIVLYYFHIYMVYFKLFILKPLIAIYFFN